MDSHQDESDDALETGTPTACRIILGAQLRRLRERANITRADAAYQIRASESKMSRVELGRVSFKERDIADLLTYYGVDDPVERESLLRLVEPSKESGWWHRDRDLMPTWFSEYLGLEESATRILTFELRFVPGLLQTEAYARAIVSRGLPTVTDDEIERRVAVRMRRQKILARPNGPRLWTVIDESTLRREVGDPGVLRRQLEALLDWTQLPHIALQVLPNVRSALAAESSFTMLRFGQPDLPDVVYIEYPTGAIYLDKPEELEFYGRSIDRLAVDAEGPEVSRQIIEKICLEL